MNKLYLNQVVEVNLHRRKLNPIRQKNATLSPTPKLSASKSVSNIFKNLNGSVIIQNFNTKRIIPKDIGEFINLPSLIDLNKVNNNFKKLDKPLESISLLDKIKLSNYKKIKKINH